MHFAAERFPLQQRLKLIIPKFYVKELRNYGYECIKILMDNRMNKFSVYYNYKI